MSSEQEQDLLQPLPSGTQSMSEDREQYLDPDFLSGGPRTRTAGAAPGQRQEVRPVLVVGVGGTGCLAVQHVMNRVREITGGKSVPFMRFLVLDTTIADDSLSRFNEGDFVNIGQLDLSSIVQNIERYEHLRTWFPKERLKPMQIGLGAMGVRHIGRLCYFQWRESPTVRERIMKRLKELKNPALKAQTADLGRLSDVTVDQSSGIDVHLVGSGSGGTGSGIFLDLAYDLRAMAKEIAGSARIIGHLVLPDAFEGLVPDAILPQIENNSHALLSEIDHFMHNGGWDVQYKGGRVQSEEPPFDLLYLLGRNGMDGGVRTRNELLGMIGGVIGNLSTTALGKHVMDSAVNLIPPILSRTDPIANRPCPYASYGIAVAELDPGEILRQGTAFVARGLLDAVAGGGDSSSGDSSGGMQAEIQADSFLSEARISFDELERMRPEVPLVRAQGPTPKEAELFRRGQHDRAVRELAEQSAARVVPAVTARFDEAVGETLAAAQRRMLTVGSERGRDGRRGYGVGDLALFLRQLGRRLEDTVRRSEERLLQLGQEAGSAERGVQTLAATLPPPADWLATYSGLVRVLDEKAVWTGFYTAIRESALGARVALNRAAERIEVLEDAVDALRDRVRVHVEELGDLESPRMRLATSEQLLGGALDDLDAPIAAVRRELGELLDRRDGRAEDLQENLGRGVQRIAERFVQERLAGRGRALGVHTVAESLDRSFLEDKLRSMRQLSQPALRCIEQYPRERVVSIGYASGARRGQIEQLFPHIDGTVQVVPEKVEDFSCLRFVYGMPLWSIQGAQRWEETAIEVQTSEGATHNLLDPRWAEFIDSVIPKSETHAEDLWLFSIYCRSGRIVKEGFTYNIYGTRLDGVRDRSAMFETFQRFLRDGKIGRERAHREVEGYLVEGRDDEGVLRLLQEHLGKLQQRLARNASQATSREEAKLLRAEITVVKGYVQRKLVDVEDRREEGASTNEARDPGDSHRQDLWLFSVLHCAGRITREGDDLFLDDRRLGAVRDRSGLVGEFRRGLLEGDPSRREVQTVAQDFLVSGDDEFASVRALRAHLDGLQKLEAEVTDEHGRATLQDEIDVVREYVTQRDSSTSSRAQV